MFKKLITACLAIAAFAAFVLPATASATNDPTLTHPTGTAIAVGTKIEATQIGNSIFTDTNKNPLVTCSTATMTGEVVKNSGGNVEGTISTSDFGGTGSTKAGEPEPECTGSFGNVSVTVPGHLCIRSTTTMATDEFQVAGGGCPGTGNVKFILDSTTIGECEYEATGAIKGDAKTHPDEAILVVRSTQEGSGAKKIRGGFFCPNSGILDMEFTLETDTKDEMKDPIYIS
jgi:hypothetical protein